MKRIAALSILLLGAALAGPKQNNVIIGSSQEPANILDYWATANLSIASEINGYMWPQLIQKNDKGQLIAVVAERVPTLKNGDYKVNRTGDKVTSNSVTYRIRKDAKWSDGTQITTRDFQFWLDVQNDARVPVPSRDPWNNAKITRIDDKAFTVTFNPPYLFADQVAPGYAPSHVMQKDWEAFEAATSKLDAKTQGQQINQAWQQFLAKFTTARGLPPVTSGAFRITNWSPGSSVTMVRNPNFWMMPRGKVDNYAKEIIYRFITDTNTLRVNVLSGQIDAVSTVGLTFDQGLEMQKEERGRFKTFFVPGAIWEHISLNVYPTVQKVKDVDLDDKRIRQAMLYAMNRDAIVQQIFQGKQPVSHSFVSTLSPLYSTNVKKYAYDVARAKELLAAAGWRPGADGILEKGGKKFQINFTTTAGNRVRERVQQIIIQNWREVGIDARVANQPAAVVFDDQFIQRASEGKWDAFMFAWVQDPSLEKGDLLASAFPDGTSNIPTSANGYSGQNIEGWKNAEYDRLYTQVQSEFDANRRKQLFQRMQDIYADELPVLPLFNRATVVTRATGLVNYTFSGANLYPSWNAWSIGWRQNGAIETNFLK